jgi:hypothetical protein
MLEIPYPEHNSEFEIQATLFAILKFNYKLDVRGEVVDRKMKSNFRKSGFQTNRFDLVVYKNKVAVCIIECKRENKNFRKEGTRQFTKYSFYNAKLFYCSSTNEIKKLAQIIFEITEKF